jgi:uncharacterized RDD family membrane protein YckC
LLVTSIAGRSLGKRILGLHTICVTSSAFRENGERRRPGWWRGLLRAAVALVGAACLGLGYWWMFLNRDRRTWHDLASGTAVVRVRARSQETKARIEPPAAA